MTDIIDNANKKADAWTHQSIDAVCKHTQPNSITECVDCGESIGAARKQAVPFATRCIRCQSAFESKKGARR